ncbi:hypothetical protein Tco_1043640 [Tanacetum coccineum]|uniref:Uncharacterized protein n=1 Tax=Tanacetum coccineum TaxID=301880 RepID=A0ABQ5GN93_9ASTR
MGPPVMPEDPYAYVPLPTAFLPTADSPGYVPESDLEEDSEEDDDEDPEEDPADRGDDGDDEDESSDDDGDADETESFETDESAATPPPHPAYRVTARISIRDEPPTPFWSDTKIPSPPLLVSSPPPASPIRSLGYRAAMIRLRAEALSTSHSPPPHIILSHTRADTPPSGTPPSGIPPLLLIPLPTLSPPLHLLSTDRRADTDRVTLSRLEEREGSGERCQLWDHHTWDEMLVDMPRAPATDDTGVGSSDAEFTLGLARTQMRSI